MSNYTGEFRKQRKWKFKWQCDKCKEHYTDVTLMGKRLLCSKCWFLECHGLTKKHLKNRKED